jgi:hypothetical protein
MRITKMKPLSQLKVEDFEAFPVWQFETETSFDEPYLSPVTALPVSDLRNRIVGAKVRLHNGIDYWAILGNIHPSHASATQQFLTLSIEKSSKWFDLARYHDVDYSRRGPADLAAFLDLPISEVFPITYNISHAAVGIPEVMAGEITDIPKKILDQTDLIELALE